ncbi:hypothetical protein [Peterkaempfera bronchialis]|uniref:hypothetical protein n=1 Tax=Peterkaempfera bronchialis TaxID=2126346 RepID=UPI001E3516BF|nr:hypothetical protein [Peterkaempfera bronchialis]
MPGIERHRVAQSGGVLIDGGDQTRFPLQAGQLGAVDRGQPGQRVAITVTVPVLITVLATLGGIMVVGIGGGLIRPMQQRWERWLSSAEEQSGAARSKIEAYQRGRLDARGAVSPQTTGGATSTEHREQPPEAGR